MGLNSQKMNLDNIRTFVILGQSNNMTEASKKLNVNVSFVSRHIKELEDELNEKLVIPTPKNKNLQLTPVGRFYFERYEKIYNEILLAEKEYKQTVQINNCKITIGTSADIEETLLKPKLLKFKEKYPNVAIKIINDTSNGLYKKLTQYAIDLMIDKNYYDLSTKLQEIKTKELYTTNYCLVYNPIYFSGNINFENFPLILPTSQTAERSIINEYFLKNKINPNIKYEFDSTDRIISYAKSGFGIGVVLKDSIESNSNLDIKDINIEARISLSYIKDKLTPSTKEFLRLFINDDEL